MTREYNMGSQSRTQQFVHQYKSISIGTDVYGNATLFCGYGPNFQLNLPDNVLAIKSLNMRISAKFDPAETNPGFDYITINGIPFFTYFYTELAYNLTVDWVADPTTHLLNASIDLSSQIPRIQIFPGEAGNQPYLTFGIGAPNNNPFSSLTNQLLLWKFDIIYTTQGIR